MRLYFYLSWDCNIKTSRKHLRPGQHLRPSDGHLRKLGKDLLKHLSAVHHKLLGLQIRH